MSCRPRRRSPRRWRRSSPRWNTSRSSRSARARVDGGDAMTARPRGANERDPDALAVDHRRDAGDASWDSSASCGRSCSRPASSARRTRLRSCSASCCCWCSAVVFAEVADGGIDSKALAMLGVLSAVNAALRPLGAGTAGIETVFFVLVFAGRVFGPGFGFALGCTSLFASAVITGGVGPWMPYQMFGCAWVGLFAGLLPPVRGKLEIAMLAAYGVVAGYFFGFMLNLQFWPFSVDRHSSIAYLPGASFSRAVAPVLRLRRHDVARLGHRPGRHEPDLHRPARAGRPRDVPSGGAPRQVPGARHLRTAGRSTRVVRRRWNRPGRLLRMVGNSCCKAIAIVGRSPRDEYRAAGRTRGSG